MFSVPGAQQAQCTTTAVCSSPGGQWPKCTTASMYESPSVRPSCFTAALLCGGNICKCPPIVFSVPWANVRQPQCMKAQVHNSPVLRQPRCVVEIYVNVLPSFSVHSVPGVRQPWCATAQVCIGPSVRQGNFSCTSEILMTLP